MLTKLIADIELPMTHIAPDTKPRAVWTDHVISVFLQWPVIIGNTVNNRDFLVVSDEISTYSISLNIFIITEDSKRFVNDSWISQTQSQTRLQDKGSTIDKLDLPILYINPGDSDWSIDLLAIRNMNCCEKNCLYFFIFSLAKSGHILICTQIMQALLVNW